MPLRRRKDQAEICFRNKHCLFNISFHWLVYFRCPLSVHQSILSVYYFPSFLWLLAINYPLNWKYKYSQTSISQKCRFYYYKSESPEVRIKFALRVIQTCKNSTHDKDLSEKKSIESATTCIFECARDFCTRVIECNVFKWSCARVFRTRGIGGFTALLTIIWTPSNLFRAVNVRIPGFANTTYLLSMIKTVDQLWVETQ